VKDQTISNRMYRHFFRNWLYHVRIRTMNR